MHLSIDGYLGCFNILAIINNAAVNIGMYVYFQISGGFFCFVLFSSGKFPKVELLDHMIIYL